MISSADLLSAAETGRLDSVISFLYGESSLSDQRRRYLDLLQRMTSWAEADQAMIITAPGRTELGGNHTDHNNGVVLAAAVHFDCVAVAGPVEKNVVRLRSKGFSDTIEVDLDDLSPHSGEEGTSTALIRGVAHGFHQAGYMVGGFDACLSSDVPVGSGLSSSAAFEVCIGQIFNQLFNKGQVPAIELARIGRHAENLHFGKPCGFMDQIACAVQGILSIDFMDQESPAVSEVDFDFDATAYQLAVVDTGGSHADLTPEYAAIPDEMHAAAKVLGHDVARGLTMQQVLGRAADIRREAGDRPLLRLIHFIEENERAAIQAQALRRENMERYLSLVNGSGDSSWRLVQNCTSTTNFMDQGIPLALALTERFLGGDGAWRVQGGGFAGTIQAYVPKAKFPYYCKFMDNIFGSGSVLPLRIRKPGHEVIRPHRTAGSQA